MMPSLPISIMLFAIAFRAVQGHPIANGNKNACDVCARLNSLEAKVGTLDEHVTQEIKRLDNRITEEGDRATRELMKLIVKLTDNNRRVNSLFSTLFAHFTKEVEKLDKHVKEEVEKINARITEEVKRT